mmetsp:Transcript_36819/g.44386  ORF Transcript_36819/g.44386 Transcript_36819/m.44386 type:complete len:495 (+) Transcript_36819:156-1640(+)|eukprot:CAMPEP_0194363832 /NCGR_PEP_ID=MMETSP0174-20130528/11697_1 /TAXON_ID=216777 /ORGANISM="Proboscia alata, Strain PI-D3" /LENGTH=494 /DNA_ID=CAMNT_0039137521 /DNA_START=114 /DNA_END=1598 /DNA_ORIENTATION=+
MAQQQHYNYPPNNGGGGLIGTIPASAIGSENAVGEQQQQPLPPSAVPILKVMRLQSPELGQPTAGMLGTQSLFSPALALPDSFGVIHAGETFTAYLGALNPSSDLPVRRLTVAAQMQTPTRRWVLPCKLDASSNEGGVDVLPKQGVDVIVGRALEEVGQHILRVEVGHGAGSKTLRKFYRFNVSSPLQIKEMSVRSGDASCFVSIAIENITTATSLTITDVDFQPAPGFVVKRIDKLHQHTMRQEQENATIVVNGNNKNRIRAVDLFDKCGRLQPGCSFRYLFNVSASSHDATLKGLACGDELGKAVFTWRKAMGEKGRISSTTVLCPPCGVDPTNPRSSGGGKYVVHGSGLSVDAAAAAANRVSSAGADSGNNNALGEALPVTVEPIDPPSLMKLAVPQEVQLLIVNHSDKPMHLQLQMRLNHMSGVVVCGPSFKNLGNVSSAGGSCVVGVRLVALVAGLFRAQGCVIVDLSSGREIAQPPLFSVFVEKAFDQ